MDKVSSILFNLFTTKIKGEIKMSETLINTNQSPATIRTLGVVLMFLGTILMGAMGAIMLWINTIIANSGKSSSTTKWNGSPEQTQIMFLILGVVMVFGFAAFVAGCWQWMTGKRNLKLIWIMLGLGIVLVIMTEVVQIFF